MHKGRTRKFTAPEEIDRQLGISKEAESSLNKTIHDKNINDTETDDDDDDDEEEEEEEKEDKVNYTHPSPSPQQQQQLKCRMDQIIN